MLERMRARGFIPRRREGSPAGPEAAQAERHAADVSRSRALAEREQSAGNNNRCALRAAADHRNIRAVWLHVDNQLAVRVRLGITDGQATELH